MCYTGKGSQTLSGLPVVLFYNYGLIMLRSSHLQPGGRESKRTEMGDYIAASCRSTEEPLDQPALPPSGQDAPMGRYRCCYLHTECLSLLSVCDRGQYGIFLLVHKFYWRNSNGVLGQAKLTDIKRGRI